MLNFIHSLDINIITFIQKYIHNDFLDMLMSIITLMGNKGIIWILISIMLILQKKYRKAGLMLVVTLVVVALLGEGIIKNIVQRNRPFLDIQTLKLIVKAPSSYSFPSGHTASSFAAATILTYNFKKYCAPFFLLAVLIAFSRVYLCVRVHYPSDIVGGIILGVIDAYVINKIFNNNLKDKFAIFYK